MKLILRFVNRKWFESIVSNICDTKPSQIESESNVVIVTQVHKVAINMYLAAIKSFLYYFGRGTVKVLSDGSLSSEDKVLIESHIPGVEIVEMSTVDTTGFPTGGCWERLLYITELVRDAYVIQIDSDTLTLNPIPEIDNAVNEQRGFCIGSPLWPETVTADYMGKVARRWLSLHVEAISEQTFFKMNFFHEGKRYIKGCAAVTGFPKGQVSRETLLEFSSEMETLIGKKKWCEWGSEQVTSNVMVAQTSNPLVLPWPRYQNFDFPYSGEPLDRVALIHFIGSNRYNRNIYRRALIQLLAKLNKQELFVAD